MRALLVLLIFVFASCQNSTTPQEEGNQTTTATLHWTGEIAADGCGFEIEIDGERYLPENEAAIPDRYKERDSSHVQLTYKALPEPIDRRCGMLPQPRIMPAIQVLQVEAL
ncbi:hypothetical protein [Pontibacter anaerobius]|uniref:Uncharacterized protein n=1 Tax=Pontibacter anaerobius TaxID=2993940 RepID=A0ABT3RGB7_9BACT|nr:hypothetical protein [Pontibacter anaerobius]MCX2740810.1 hypothetical protein [Pontibacter anaerobius]